MPSHDQNPFPPGDPDRHAIWEMLVRRDIDAFVAVDWSLTEPDFVTEGFFGVHAHGSANPDSWRLGYDLASYKADWLGQAEASARKSYKGSLRDSIFAATVLRDIDVHGDAALAHKKFDGTVEGADGTVEVLNWQTLYVCRRVGGRWKIAGFTGYMPHPMTGARRGAA